MSQTPSEVTGRSYIDAGTCGLNTLRVGETPAPDSRRDLHSKPKMSPEWGAARWYAAYTKSRHEKSVAEQLRGKGVEAFLPLYRTVRRWKNGEHWVELPLFPGYTFARFALADRLPVLKVQGVVRLVGFNGMPVALQDGEVESLRTALAEGICAEPHPYLTAGCSVRITAGPLAGREGILLRWHGSTRVVLSIDLIHRSVLVDVAADSLERI
ncbi:MAG: UpxY family transcription antiterminator [Acidobacteria bacterium]|nr:MAG: UpxY family transcription antiterminator [Acidobacteriota bacterium]